MGINMSKHNRYHRKGINLSRSSLPEPAKYYAQYFSIPSSNRGHVLVHCCFHDDRTPSLSIDLTDGWFNCFGCGTKGGDVLAFHMLKHNLKFIDACRDLGVLR
jgi:hypothetical protein